MALDLLWTYLELILGLPWTYFGFTVDLLWPYCGVAGIAWTYCGLITVYSMLLDSLWTQCGLNVDNAVDNLQAYY